MLSVAGAVGAPSTSSTDTVDLKTWTSLDKAWTVLFASPRSSASLLFLYLVVVVVVLVVVVLVVVVLVVVVLVVVVLVRCVL